MKLAMGTRMLTPHQVKLLQHKLLLVCLVHDKDSYKIHINRIKGLKILNTIIRRADFSEMSTTLVVHLIWCSMSCIHHFQIWLRLRGGLLQWSRRRLYRRALAAYDDIVRMLMPEMYVVLLQAVISFYKNAEMWKIEHMCSELLIRLVHYSTDPALTLNEMLNLVEHSLRSNVDEAREIIKVFYEVIDTIKWIRMDLTLLDRLLRLYKFSVMPEVSAECLYVPLRKGFELSVRNLMRNLSNDDLMEVISQMLTWIVEDRSLSDEMILEMGNVLEYATILYESGELSLWPIDVLPTILRLIESKNIIVCLLGNRVFQNMIDRMKNRNQFLTPRIFYQDAEYDIKLNTYNQDDRDIFRKYRKQIHLSFIDSVVKQGDNRISLENMYTSLALMLVEVPCGYTAAAAVCLAMALQETALTDDKMAFEHCHRVHATVTSLMTLVCYIHKAEIFYEYVNTVLMNRACTAPHLNPPLRTSYEYCQHHILWKKPDLFFEDWEARYGLWKCFRTKKTNFQVVAGQIVGI